MSISSEHWLDTDGNPAGGCTYGTGFAISWQNGPIGSGTSQAKPNGASVEDVVYAALNRLEFFQTSKFACSENEHAISMIKAALHFLEQRDKDREKRGVEGRNVP
jgi:hypothetical protein